jgi:hypothetical protein
MVSLTTGPITAYFGIIGFLGVEKAAASAVVGKWDLTEITIFMILSLLAFIGASFPVPMRLAISNPQKVIYSIYLWSGPVRNTKEFFKLPN